MSPTFWMLVPARDGNGIRCRRTGAACTVLAVVEGYCMSTHLLPQTIQVVRGFVAAQAHARLVEQIPLSSRCDYEYDTPQEIIHFDTDLQLAGVPLRRWIVGDIDHPVAAAFCFRTTWNTPRHTFWAHIRVHPDAQHQGIGQRLLATVQQWAAAAGAQAIRIMAHPDAHTEQFLAQTGFTQIGTEQKFALDLTTFHHAEVAPPAIAGYQITTLSQLMQQHEDAIEQACMLHAAISLDVPMPDEPIVTITKFRRLLGEALDPQHYLLAHVDDMLVGESILMESDSDAHDYWQHATGVVPAFRGMGIAKHLKISAILAAKQLGARRLLTWMETSNAPIIHLNRELGFEPLDAPGSTIHVYERTIRV